MKKYLFIFFLSLPLILHSQNIQSIPTSNIIVRFQPKVKAESFFKKFLKFHRHSSIQITIHRKVSTIFNIYAIQTNYPQALIRQLKQYSEVLKAGYDTPLIYRNTTPNDVDFQQQWNMLNAQADLVWEETTGGQTADGKRIVIGVLEKGIDPTHEDLKDNIWTNKAERPDNGLDDDHNGYVDDYFGLNLLDLTDEHTPTERGGFRTAHGTQVAGVIGAKGNNKIGIAGINWDIDLLLFSKVSFASEVLEAQEYAHNLRKKFNETNGAEGAFVVALNYSFGYDGDYKNFEMGMGEELCEMIELIGQVGILSVVATYNQSVDVEEVGDVLPSCPSDFVIAVTSSNERNEQTKESGFGRESIDLAAPGERIYTLGLDNSYGLTSGTSLACPLVAGTVGLLYSLPCAQIGEDAVNTPAATANFIKDAILNGIQPIAGSNGRSLTGGRLDAFNAMKNVQLFCGQIPSDQFVLSEFYPNPVSDQLTIRMETPDFGNYQLNIVNNLGQVLLHKTIKIARFDDNVLVEDVRFLTGGIYFLTLSNSKQTITQRFIKN